MHSNKRRPNNMGGGGQHRHHNNRPRRFNNNRPGGEGGNDAASIARTRRNATQNREKYQMMAHDATRGGDRVLAEYYLQHADHYHRVLLELPPEEIRPQHQPRHHQGGGEQQPAEGAPTEVTANGDATHASEHHSLPPFITQGSHPTSEE